jgi:hypothetical protein
MLGQGILIFIYLAVLTALEFFVAITFRAVPLLVVVAIVKAALVVYYYMHVYKLNLESELDDQSYDYKAGTNRLGLWLFLVSDSFVFAGLMVMRVNLLGSPAGVEPDAGAGRDRCVAHLLLLYEPRRDTDAQWRPQRFPE